MPDNFQSMTKAEIGAYGAKHKINLNEREMTKPEMIAALEAGLAAKGEQTSNVETFTILDRSQHPDVKVFVNGMAHLVPVGVSTPLSDSVRHALDAARISYRKD